MNRLQRRLGVAIANLLTKELEAPPSLPVDMARLRGILRPADVILVEGHARISAAIKYLTQSTWSHAALYAGDGMIIEADVVDGVRLVGLESVTPYHMRICRPLGLNADERAAVVAYARGKLGTQYDLRYVVDLARYLFPVPVPKRWRRRAIGFGAADPTRAICSTLVADAFKSIRYPVLPELDGGRAALFHVHGEGLLVPRDFDVSPYFAVLKPEMPKRFDHHLLVWVD